MCEVIHTDKAPRPVGPYSQGVLCNGFLFTSGQIPVSSEDGKIIRGDFEEEVMRVLRNIASIAQAAGGGVKSIIKVNVYLKDIENYKCFNEVYEEFFKQYEYFPARTTVTVSSLPGNVDLEVDAVVYVGGKD